MKDGLNRRALAVHYLLIHSLAALAFWLFKVFAKRWIENLHVSADADE
jgi:hypothetical protein